MWLLALTNTFLFCALVALFGITGAYIVAFVLSFRSVMPQGAVASLKIAQWAPFFLLCALPQWSIKVVSTEFVGGVVIASSFVLGELILIAKKNGKLRATGILPLVMRGVLHVLFFAVYLEVFRAHGWVAELSFRPESMFGLLIVICLFLFVLETASRTDFYDSAKQYGDTLLDFIEGLSSKHAIIAIVLGALSILVWQLASEFTSHYFALGSPLDVAVAGYSAFNVNGEIGRGALSRGWSLHDASVSILEVVGGTSLGGAASTIVHVMLKKYERLRRQVRRIVIFTYISPLVLVFGFSQWTGRSAESLLTVVVIATVVFYPQLRAMVGCDSAPFRCRLLVVAAESVPFAFVGMIIGEAWAASKGLAFFVILNRSQGRIDEAMAISLSIFFLYIISEVVFWVALKRGCETATQT